MPEPEIDQPLRVAPDRRRVDDWALALASAGIESRSAPVPAGVALLVRAADLAAAHSVLTAFDAENVPPPSVPELPTGGRTYGAVVVAALLCVFFVVTGPRDRGYYWFDRGAAFASRIATGEVWRVVTALTLHANFPHILGNAATLVIFGTSLCAMVGTGVGVWVMLLAGAAGNWLTALLRGAPYSSVGASTGIFGAIGALAAIQLIRRRRGVAVPAWRAWTPVAAGLALLGFLGTAPEADVLAHLFGFAVGSGLGAWALRLQPLRQRRGVQAALSAAAALAVIGCWLFAVWRG
jgi:rhomboid protease GluP